MATQRSTRRKRAATPSRKAIASSESIAELFESLHAWAHRRAGAGSWVWDSATGVIRGSEEAVRIGGLQEDSMQLEMLLERVVDADRDTIRGLVRRALEDGQEFETDVRVMVGKELRTVRVSGKPESPRSTRLAGTVEDVTARRAADAALLVLSTAVEQSPDHICVAAIDGTLEYVNPAFYNATTLPLSTPFVPPHLSVVLGGEAGFEEARRTVGHGAIYRRVFERRRNGNLAFEEITVAPVRNARGELTNLIVIGTDVTERRRVGEDNVRLQTALQKALDEWRHTVDSIESGIVLFDSAATIRRLNRPALDLLGATAYTSVVGSAAAALPAHNPWRGVRRMVNALTKTPSRDMRREVTDRASGRTWQIFARAASDPEAGDGVIVVITDITATVQLNESLRRSETMSALGSLVGGVAHEVKNPLFGMSATLEAMESKFGRDGDLGRYTHALRREVNSLNALMRDLLDYGRPRALDLQRVRIGAIVVAALETCLSTAAERGVAVENLISTDFGPCRADPIKMQQVVRNLLENAIQHSRQGSAVTMLAWVERRADGPWIVFTVRDRGRGFDPADLPHVFEPFFTRRAAGTGLGLSIVQRTVESHGGRVTASNHPEGGGVVCVEIPTRIGDDE